MDSVITTINLVRRHQTRHQRIVWRLLCCIILCSMIALLGISEACAFDEDAPGRKRDEVDSRAPRNKSLDSLLVKLRSAVTEGRTRDTNGLFNSMLAIPDNSVTLTPSGKWVPLWSEVNKLLSTLPETTRRTLSGSAKQQLTQAQKTGDIPTIAAVATRFMFHAIGQEAANDLATIHFNRGEFGMAANWLQRLSSINAPISKSDAFRSRANVANALAGFTSQDELMLDNVYDMSLADTRRQPLKDWPLVMGTADRRGTATSGQPLLLSRWQLPLSSSRETSRQIATLVDELSLLGRAVLPSMHAISNDELLASRNLDGGIQVVNLRTGRPVWRSEPQIPIQTLMSRTSSRTIFNFNGRVAQTSQSTPADTNRLTNLLFRDAAWGMLSSSHDQLYLLEDHALNLGSRINYYSRSANRDPYRRDWKSNKLAAYDFRTGRPRWTIGGQYHDEPFDLPLAGTYFHGAPTPVGNELMVIGERGDQLLLFALDALTGKSLWSVNLATSTKSIDMDFERRGWPSQVAVKDSIVVCPTGVGWLVGVDRLSRSIIWAHRYSKPSDTPTTTAQPRFGFRATTTNNALNTRWSPMPPVIVGHRVLFTPSESAGSSPSKGTLVCLNLFNGNRLWNVDKDRHVYLAGVSHNRPVVVGLDGITAFDIESGKSAWQIPFGQAAGRPSGRGIEVDGHYWLPLTSGSLWKIDLANGKQVATSELSDDSWMLGNLMMVDGKFISLSTAGIECFEQQEALESEIQHRLAKNARDIWALERRAQTHLTEKRFDSALEDFDKIRVQDLAALDQSPQSEAMRRTLHNGKFQALSARIRDDFRQNTADFERLKSIAKSPHEKLVVSQFDIERRIAKGAVREAFEQLNSLASTQVDELIPRMDNSQTVLRLDVWISGRLRDLWESANQPDRQFMDTQIRKMASQAAAETFTKREEFLKLYEFHVSAIPVLESLIKYHESHDDFSRAESYATRISLYADRRSKAMSLFRKLELYRNNLLVSDALQIVQQLSAYSDIPLNNEQNIGQYLAANPFQETTQDENSVQPWSQPLALSRGVAQYYSTNAPTLNVADSALPYFSNHRLEYSVKNQRLELLDNVDDSSVWSIPLRKHPRGLAGTSIIPVGHQLAILNHDVLHYVSSVDHQIKWTQQLDVRGGSQGYYNSPTQQNLFSMKPLGQISVEDTMAARSARRGRVDAAFANFLCYRSRNQLTVTDTEDGQVRWIRAGVPKVARIMATPSFLLIIPNNSNEVVGLRTSDGREISIDSKLAKTALKAIDDDLVILKASESNADVYELQRVNAFSGKIIWNLNYSAKTLFSRIDDDSIALLSDEGDLMIVDLKTGKRSVIAKLSKDELANNPGFVALAGPDTLTIVRNDQGNPIRVYPIPAIDVNGTIRVFSRSQNKLLWKRRFNNMQYLIQQRHAPVSVFIRRNEKREGNAQVARSHFAILNRLNGKVLFDKEVLSAPFGSNAYRLIVDQLAGKLEIHSGNERFRFSSPDKK